MSLHNHYVSTIRVNQKVRKRTLWERDFIKCHFGTCMQYIHITLITPFKGAKIIQFFGKQNCRKRAHTPFLALNFRYKIDIFQRKKKLHIDLKKKNKIRIDQKYHTNIMSGDQRISQRKSSVII